MVVEAPSSQSAGSSPVNIFICIISTFEQGTVTFTVIGTPISSPEISSISTRSRTPSTSLVSKKVTVYPLICALSGANKLSMASYTSSLIASGRIAIRAPMRAAFVICCVFRNSHPYLIAPIVIRNSIGSTKATSTVARPR